MRLRIFSLLFLFAIAAHGWSQAIPRVLQGTWHVTRVVPTQTSGCWSGDKANKFVNTNLTYAGNTLRWQGGSVPVTETLPRTLTAQEFETETGNHNGSVALTQLGIRTLHITEYDLQHDDVDVTDVTTEAPGDAVLLVNPSRIIVSICGTYFEATRAGATVRSGVSGR